MGKTRTPRQSPLSSRWVWIMLAFMVVGIMGAGQPFAVTSPFAAAEGSSFHAFSFMTDDTYSFWERLALILNVIIAFAGLGYAVYLIKEVYQADTGTERMKEIARAVREGAMAY